jgi:hypothetical protein
VNAKGEVTSVSGGTAPGGAIPAQLSEQFTGADVIRSFIGPVFSTGAPTTVSVGDKWTTKSTMKGQLGDINVTHNYTLKSASGSRALMAINGTVSLGTTGGAASIKDGSSTGEAVWNPEKGMLESLDMEQKLTVEQATGPAKTQSTQTMKMKVRRK